MAKIEYVPTFTHRYAQAGGFVPDTPADCTLADGQVLNLATATPEQLADCKIGQGAVLRLEDEGADGEAMTAPPTPANPEPQPSPPPRPSAPNLSANLIPRNNLEPTQTPDVAAAPSTDSLAPPAAHDAGSGDAGQEKAANNEHLEVAPASPSAGEIGDLIGSAGGGAVGLAAALIAVVGGTAGFKLWTKISEQKHEQSMKKLDIEQANAGLQGAQPPPCQAAHHTLLAEIKSLNVKIAEQETRLAKAEKASAGFDPSVDVGDLEDRVEVLEKAFRKKSRTVGGE